MRSKNLLYLTQLTKLMKQIHHEDIYGAKIVKTFNVNNFYHMFPDIDRDDVRMMLEIVLAFRTPKYCETYEDLYVELEWNFDGYVPFEYNDIVSVIIIIQKYYGYFFVGWLGEYAVMVGGR